MLKKSFFWVLLGLIGMGLSSGCATTGGRTAQADLDALNARIMALQSQLSEKDSEIAKLQNQMRDEETARVQAENERRRLADQLDSTLVQLESSKKASKPAPDSDLK